MIRRRLGRNWERVGAAAALALAGCTDATAPCVAELDLRGTWTYVAEAISPVRQRLNGAVRVDEGPSCAVAGVADVVTTDLATGVPGAPVRGTVAGRVASPTTIDFDLVLLLSTRRHLGTVTRDSIYGSWFATSDGVGGPQGTFVLRRSAP
ncbi:MAG: hypothetical protein MUF53_12090 [Gemmatimonadaceae bacterium]|jgi:hypothetical protein|nr:hypothetical protein [Gemmatimonadaceae bacterium]